TPCQTPVGPSNLTATAVSSSEIDLRWQDNDPNVFGYRIDRSVDGVVFTSIGFLTGSTVNFRADKNLSPSTRYYYEVRAYNQVCGLSSNWSNVASATTYAGATPTPTATSTPAPSTPTPTPTATSTPTSTPTPTPTATSTPTPTPAPTATPTSTATATSTPTPA